MLRKRNKIKTAVVHLDKKSHARGVLQRGLLFLSFATLILAVLLVLSVNAGGVQARENSSETLADLAARLQGAVVNISTSQKVKSPFGNGRPPQLPKGLPFEKFFKDFLDKPPQNRQQRVSSLGSGFVIDESGLIVTNNHVIKGADEIFVNFDDGRKLKVIKVLGKDAKTDLALLQVKPEKPLKAIKFGNSAKSRVGDWVMAIGNPFGLGGTVTVGIVSAKNRDINSGPYDEFIQTDAAINKGNSGGPLFNMAGEVIGVNTAIISPSGGSIGIGFSVPSNTVVNVIDQLRRFGETRRGWLGVLIQKVTPEIADGLGMSEAKGALVARVTKDSPAAKAGLASGDIIINFDGHDVKSSLVLPKIVALTPVEKTVNVKILRRGVAQDVAVTIALLDEKKLPVSPMDKPVIEDDNAEILGMTLSNITPELRRKFRIGDKTQGVVITKVDPGSRAAEKGIKAGYVIVDVMQEKVTSPDEVLEKIEMLQKANKKNIIFFISRGGGEFGFVALPTTPAG